MRRGTGIQADVGGGESHVQRIRGIPVELAVVAPFPLDAEALAHHLVSLADAHAFQPTDLLKRHALGGDAREAQSVHPPDGPHVPFLIYAHLRLAQKVGAGAGLPHAKTVIAHGALAAPNGHAAAVADHHHGGVGDAGARSHQKHGDGGDGHGDALVGPQEYDGAGGLRDRDSGSLDEQISKGRG